MKSTVWIGVFVLCSVLGAQAPVPRPTPETPSPQAPPPAKPEAQTPVPASTDTTPIAAPAENIENMSSIALFNWQPSGQPKLVGGAQAVNVAAESLNLPTKPSQANGFEITLRAKGPTRIEFSYFDVKDTGNATAAINLSLFGTFVSAGEFMSIDYRIRSMKLSWNYLTYPVPSLDSKLRFKTLWEVQYTQMHPLIAFPIVGDFPVSVKQFVLLPTVGVGLEYVPSPKHFRMETRLSGFGIPGHAAIGDGQASLVGRFGNVEAFAGIKAYYFRSSPQKDIYMKSLLYGPSFGLRWVFKP